MNYYTKQARICPICEKEYAEHPALSRIDNKTEICSKCGNLQAIAIFIKFKNQN